MKPSLIDTDILSMFFRNNQNVVSNFKAYLKKHDKINDCGPAALYLELPIPEPLITKEEEDLKELFKEYGKKFPTGEDLK